MTETMKMFHLTAPVVIAASLVSCENPADKTADATTTDAVVIKSDLVASPEA